jgi:hypothetical protein
VRLVSGQIEGCFQPDFVAYHKFISHRGHGIEAFFDRPLCEFTEPDLACLTQCDGMDVNSGGAIATGIFR